MPSTSAIEMILRIKTENAAALKQIQDATKNIGTEAQQTAAKQKEALAAAQQAILDQLAAIKNLGSASATVLLQQLEAFDKEAAAAIRAAIAVDQLAKAHKGLVPEVAAAGGAIRVLEGQLPIRAIERFTTNVLGLGPILQAAFPIVGAVAIGEEFLRLFGKIDPLKKAETELSKVTKQLDTDYAQLGKRLERLEIQEITNQFGKLAGAKLAAFYSESNAQEDKARIKDLQRQIEETQSKLAGGRFGSPLPGLLGQYFTQRGEQAARDKIAGLQDQQNFLKAKVTVDERQTSTDLSEAQKEARKEAEAQAKRTAEETIRLQEQLATLQAKDLLGIAKINQLHDAEAAKLFAKNELTKKNLDLLNQISVVLANNNFQEVLKKGRAAQIDLAQKNIEGNDAQRTRGVNLGLSQVLHDLRQTIGSEQADLGPILKAIALSDQADADHVLRQLDVATKGNARSTKSTGQKSNDNYQARVAAANDIFDIETRHLDLIETEGKREEALAAARKKYSDEIYRAEAQHEEDLAAIRAKSLEEYKKTVVGLANALLAGGDAPKKFLEGEGRKLLDQVVGNVAGLTYDVVKKNIPVISGQTNSSGQLTGLGKILQGTPLGVDQAKLVQQAQVSSTVRLTGSNDSLRASVDRLAGVFQGSGRAAGGVAGIGGAAGSIAGISDPGSILSGADGGGYDIYKQAGIDPSYKGTQYSSAGKGIIGKVGTAAAIGGGAFQAFEGFKQGGLKGAASGIGGTLATAAGVAALFGPAGAPVAAALGIAAGVTDLISSFLGSSKEKRAKQISNELAQNQYQAPTSLRVTQTTNGNYTFQDARGNLQTSDLRAVPTVAEPYITSRRLNGDPNRTYYDAPGNVLSPFSGSAQGSGEAPRPSIHITLTSIDTQSGVDFLMKNHRAIGEALADHLQNHEGRASNAIRFIAR